MKKAKVLLISLAAAAVAIQLVPVRRTNPPVESDLPAPAEVATILRGACYDCHSNATVWPWYSHLAPVSWLVASDTSEGRSKFNLSTWNRYGQAEQTTIRTRMGRMVHGGDMPPWYYALMHPAARLTAGQKAQVEAWAAGK